MPTPLPPPDGLRRHPARSLHPVRSLRARGAEKFRAAVRSGLRWQYAQARRQVGAAERRYVAGTGPEDQRRLRADRVLGLVDLTVGRALRDPDLIRRAEDRLVTVRDIRWAQQQDARDLAARERQRSAWQDRPPAAGPATGTGGAP